MTTAIDLVGESKMTFVERMSVAHQRAWINQPSKNQEFHSLHGKNVIISPGITETARGKYVTVYFTEGSLVSQVISVIALSKGWRTVI